MLTAHLLCTINESIGLSLESINEITLSTFNNVNKTVNKEIQSFLHKRFHAIASVYFIQFIQTIGLLMKTIPRLASLFMDLY